MKELLINGRTMEVAAEVETVKQLMEHLDLKSPIIIVEHNEEVLQKPDHELVKVQAGDTIEFVQFVGGG